MQNFSGYCADVTIYEPFRRRHVLEFIRALKKAYGYGHEFEIEKITEGGIRFVNWPGKVDESQYKSIRFPFYGSWPHINPKEDPWSLFQSEEILLHSSTGMGDWNELPIIAKVYGKDVYWTSADSQRVSLALYTLDITYAKDPTILPVY